MTQAGKASEPDVLALTIDELARRVDMSVRNLREWRALGLLPPPEMRGRVGYYDPGQVERLTTIKELQGEGFTLELIRRLLEASGDQAAAAMRFARDLRAPFRAAEPLLVDLEALAAAWNVAEPDALRRAIDLGLVRKRSDGRLEFTSARIAAVGETLNELGLSAEEVLDATTEIRAHLDAIAGLFERVWRRHIWDPYVAAGLPPEGVPGLRDKLAKIQPLAFDAVVALFSIAMDATIAKGIAREVDRQLRRNGDDG